MVERDGWLGGWAGGRGLRTVALGLLLLAAATKQGAVGAGCGEASTSAALWVRRVHFAEVQQVVRHCSRR